MVYVGTPPRENQVIISESNRVTMNVLTSQHRSNNFRTFFILSDQSVTSTTVYNKRRIHACHHTSKHLSTDVVLQGNGILLNAANELFRTRPRERPTVRREHRPGEVNPAQVHKLLETITTVDGLEILHRYRSKVANSSVLFRLWSKD